MTAAPDRHAPHIWHLDARGVVRCAFQDCQADPTPEDAALVLADVDTAAGVRIAIDYSARA